MAPRAVYTFSGFPGTPERNVCLHHDGYPTGAAWRFATALRDHSVAAAFLVSFLSTQPAAEALVVPEQAADAEYRYQVKLNGSRGLSLQVQCWRRLPGDSGWQPGCGPMALEMFIQRFLPGDPLGSDATEPDLSTAPPRGADQQHPACRAEPHHHFSSMRRRLP